MATTDVTTDTAPFADLAIPNMGVSGDFTMRVGNLVALGYDTTESWRLDKYPIFDETYRDPLNHKILAHYIFREIGYESFEQFRFALGRKMSEIMPYYNQLYSSTQLKFDPMSTINLASVSNNDSTAESSAKSQNEETASSTTDSSGNVHERQRTVSSDTPDAVLSNTGDYASQVGDVDNTRDTTEHVAASSSSSGTQQSDFTHQQQTGKGDTTTTGYSGLSGSALLMQYRQTLLNIDMMIINDCAELFMGLADSGDNMSPVGYGGFSLW